MPLDNGPVDYRQLQNPVNPLTPGELPSTGKAQEAEALAGLFHNFGKTADTFGVQASQVYGERQGKDAGSSGTPSLKTGIAQFTAFGQAYNNAATGAFLTESEIHAEDTASKLRVQANNDPTAFASSYGAAADAAVKEAPAQIQGAMRDLYNRHLAAGVSALSGSQALEIQQKNKDVYDQGTARSVTRVAILQGSPNPADQAAAVEEHQKLIQRIQGGVEARLYSPTEADAKITNSMRDITSQVFTTNVDRELANMASGKGSTGVVDLLENFRKMHEQNMADTTQPPVLSEAEYGQLMGQAKQKLQQQNLLDAALHRDSKSAEQLKLEAGDRTITIAMATPHADPNVIRTMVMDMIHTEDLKPEVGRAVLASLKTGQDAPPNYDGLARALSDPKRFDWKPEDIANAVSRGEFNSKQSIELVQHIEHDRNDWPGMPAVKDAHAYINSELKIPSGIDAMTATEEQKTAGMKANVELDRQLTALSPDKRVAEAPRLAKNVVLDIQAKEQESRAAYLAKTTIKGDDPATIATRTAERDRRVKEAQDKAAALRSGIK